MFVALNELGERIDIFDALKNRTEKYFCPVCNGKLGIKDGQINISHFAHESLDECDTFSSDMSEWHREWQKQFPIENREIVLEHEGERHRADVCIGNYVVEFQHSKISNEEFNERNWFYTTLGYKVIWIFDVREEFQTHRMECYDEWERYDDNGGKFRWKYAWKFMKDWIPTKDINIIVFFQTVENDLQDDENPYMERVIWAIEEYGESNFKRFFTSYYPSCAIDLLEHLQNRKL